MPSSNVIFARVLLHWHHHHGIVSSGCRFCRDLSQVFQSHFHVVRKRCLVQPADRLKYQSLTT